MGNINFENQPTKIVTVKELESIMNSVGLNFYGFKNVSVSDREMFEEKTSMSFEPTSNGQVRLHDLSFVWQD